MGEREEADEGEEEVGGLGLVSAFLVGGYVRGELDRVLGVARGDGDGDGIEGEE